MAAAATHPGSAREELGLAHGMRLGAGVRCAVVCDVQCAVSACVRGNLSAGPAGSGLVEEARGAPRRPDPVPWPAYSRPQRPRSPRPHRQGCCIRACPRPSSRDRAAVQVGIQGAMQVSSKGPPEQDPTGAAPTDIKSNQHHHHPRAVPKTEARNRVERETR